ncbi:MAG: hypothetical protein JXB39_14735 [Deltaproteobacteria bacterium]|nr:hypothetical protein [Deltaproteobacteria bacterium]
MRASILLPCLPLAGCLVHQELYDERADALGRGSWGVGFETDSDCLVVDARDLDLGDTFTFDAYLQGDAAPGPGLFPVVSWPGAFAVYQDTDGYLVMGSTDTSDASAGTSTSISLLDGARHHLAAGYGQNGYASLFLDGTRVAFASLDLAPTPGDTLYLGCWPEEEVAFRGVIGEVRLSAAAFYGTDFTPEWTPYPVSDATLALWHLEEGDGVEVRDEVGVAPGRLSGGVWVPFPL